MGKMTTENAEKASFQLQKTTILRKPKNNLQFADE
jgi:hypothetical protein